MRAVTTGPSTGFEAIVPGRQDKFQRNGNPDFRSASLICGTAHFSLPLVSSLFIKARLRRLQDLADKN